MRVTPSLLLVLFLAPLGAGQGLGPPPVPPGNPITPEKALLGKALFWEEQLASTRAVACGTCHVPAHGMSDPRSAVAEPRLHPGPDGLFGTVDDKLGSPGVGATLADGSLVLDPIFRLQRRVGTRKAPTTLNAAFLRNLFWDARIESDVFFDPVSGTKVLDSNATLENLIVEPPLNESEMSHLGRDWNDVVARVLASAPLALSPALSTDLENWIPGRDYAALFEEAFGSPGVTAPRIVMAIATYLRTLVTDQAPIDDFRGGDQGALTKKEKRGLDVFERSDCAVCHVEPLFTDDLFHNTGVRPPAEDHGRFGFSGDPAEEAMFRTPSLRNVALREPLFHHGRMATLEDVVEFYDRGGDFAQDPFSDRFVRRLGLTDAEKSDLLAFLRGALTDDRVAQEVTPFDRPMLWSESNRVAQEVGPGVPGTGGHVPVLVADEPAALGNPNQTIGIDHGLGAAPGLVLAVLDFQGFVFPFVLPTGPLQGSGPGQGYDSLSLALPSDPALAGSHLLLRWYVADAGAGHGLAATQTVSFEID